MEKQPKIFNKGLYTDTNEEFQPDGTYRFVLNGVLESFNGDKGSVTNELGNEVCFSLPEQYSSYKLIGACLLADNRIVLFLTNDVNSIIGIQNSDCSFDILISTDCLAFDSSKPVDCLFKLHNGCDYYIYFTDSLNVYKSINLNNLDYYKPDGVNWDCGLMNISPEYNLPDIYLNRVFTGGLLKLGAYQFTIRYLDPSLNPTNWMYLTNPVYITQPSENLYDAILNTGGNLNGASLDGFYYTNKSIEIAITNLDDRYKYYQIGIIESAQGTSTISGAYVSTPKTILSTSDKFVLSGIGPQLNINSVDPSEITVPNLFINVVHAHAQVENKLLLGNHSEQVRDWSVFQQAANDIQTEYFAFYADAVTDTGVDSCQYQIGVFDNDPTDSTFYQNYSNPTVSYDNKTFMRDEVYALGIVWVFKNGFESPVFHIPGRIKIGTPIDADDTSTTTALTVNGNIYDSAVGWTYWDSLGDTYNIDPLIPDEWDTKLYNISNLVGLIYVDPLLFPNYSPTDIGGCENVYSQNRCGVSTDIPRWKHVNTSIAGSFNQSEFVDYKHVYTVSEVGIMGYYETDTTYPDTRDCNGVPIYPHDTIDDGLGNITYRMHKIRHHLMPDARKLPIHSDGSESGMTLYPIGVRYSNVQVPADYADEIQGYYFVRSDRAGNKTVIDKGWLNVTDVTFGLDNTATQALELDDDDKTIEQNKWFLTPGFKNGYGALGSKTSVKFPQSTGFNIVEFFSPKSSFNDLTNLGGDYYKFERTVYGRYHYQPERTVNTWVEHNGATDWTCCLWAVFEQSKLPEMYNFENRDTYFLSYKFPIDGSEYTLYNENNLSSVANGYTLKNDNHRQTIMLSKLFNEPAVPNYPNHCYINKPRQTALYDADGEIIGGKEDIIPWDDVPQTATVGGTRGWTGNLYQITDEEWIQQGLIDHAVIGEDNIGEQFTGTNTNYSPFAYYAALKSNIIPYSKLEQIRYIRTSNYLIESNNEHYAVAGGDCFIARQQLIKTYMKNNGSNNYEEAGSLVWGYVESEINAHFRNKEQGDDYYAYPWDSIEKSIFDIVEELKDELRDQAEQLYHYRLDYSKDNDDRLYLPLADEFDYCTDCSGSFPHTVYYSNTSFPDEVTDQYRIFKVNNQRSIPSDTGEITNLIIKEENLFAFTTNNLWKFNISPQQLQTNNDTIQVGQGEFLGLRPIKLFDNKQGVARGGMEFKFSGVFADDSYFWVDNLSGRVFRLEKGVEEVSLLGMKRFFKNNLTLKLRDDFMALPGVDYDYPHMATTSGRCIGFHGVYDPQYLRYILHKRDFTLTQDARDIIQPLPDLVNVEEGMLYYNEFGFIVGLTSGNGINLPGSIEIIEILENWPQWFKNESFTISFSLQDKAWVGYHSYLPTFMYNNFNTYFSYYAQNINFIDKTWKHNVDNYTTYCNIKQDFIIDFISNQSPYVENSFDTIEYTSNVFEYDSLNEDWKEIQMITFDRLFVYNNNQISNLKSVTVSNLLPYQHIQYNVNTSYAVKERNFWRINRFRDMCVDRINTPQPLFTKDWGQTTYRNNFSTTVGVGFIDKVINPDAIDINKNVYKQLRFTDKYFGVRLFFKPQNNYKINFNLGSNLKRNKL